MFKAVAFFIILLIPFSLYVPLVNTSEALLKPVVKDRYFKGRAGSLWLGLSNEYGISWSQRYNSLGKKQGNCDENS